MDERLDKMEKKIEGIMLEINGKGEDPGIKGTLIRLVTTMENLDNTISEFKTSQNAIVKTVTEMDAMNRAKYELQKREDIRIAKRGIRVKWIIGTVLTSISVIIAIVYFIDYLKK